MARKNVFYRQCRLVKDMGQSQCVQVSWIPDQFAELGRTLKLRDEDKNWENGWVVRGVGRNRLAAADVPDFHELSKAHLRATGDAETA
ncbi:hypothetical protein [Limnoglobus roseus]|uniref:Uncharacterized protein n=1 Tax=Limnoglobus roseus TaxID=2598579 RepID=A0A5C1ATA9_9BACT|nr:hypothetical protein [Limnoglobus roseus]QEL20078.1 hypothetical protein PX52LOC_07165 [Limnoglobus roseus]